MWRVGGLAGLACALLLLVSCGGGEPAVPQTAAPQRAAAQAPLAANILSATALFDWAAAHYSQFFAGGYLDGTLGPYQYRHFPLTGNYVGVGDDGQVYVKFGANEPFAVGSLASFECQVYPSNCPVTTPPASDAVALSGIYAGSANGASPRAFLIIAADGSFFGTNTNNAGSRFDVFDGTATAQPAAWSAANARYGTYTSAGLYATLGSANFTGGFTNAASATATLAITGVSSVGNQLAVDYDTLSNTPASVWIASGLYTVPAEGQAIAIDSASGSISGTFQSDCSIAGTLSVPSPSRNVYKVSATLSGLNCPVTGAMDLLGYYYTDTAGLQTLFLAGATSGSQMAYVQLQFQRRP
jgi:hypothetical protein